MDNNHMHSTAFLRVVLGLLFLVPGIGKITDPNAIITMLGNLGFPGSAFFGWVLILSEIIFGLALILGYKVKYAVWPLMFVLVVALVKVHLKDTQNPMMWIDVLLRLSAIAGMNMLRHTGSGSWAVSKE